MAGVKKRSYHRPMGNYFDRARKAPAGFFARRSGRGQRQNCPFCPEQEAKTAYELLVYGRNGGGANSPGWSIRVDGVGNPASRKTGESCGPISVFVPERLNVSSISAAPAD